MSCDSDSDSNCKNCDIPPINEQQCCAICPSTGERCKRKAEKGKHRCLQHGQMCKDLHTEYKKVCEGLLDIIYEDLTDEEFYNKYKSVQLCLYKRKKQTEICYPGYPNKYSDCYYNIKHEKILNKYEKILNKFKSRFEKLDLLKREEFKERKEKQKEQEYEELKEKELIKNKLMLKKSPDVKKKSKQKKSKQKKKKKSPINKEIKEEKKELTIEQLEKENISCEEQKCEQLMDKKCIKYCINNCDKWIEKFIELNLNKNILIKFPSGIFKGDIKQIIFELPKNSNFNFYQSVKTNCLESKIIIKNDLKYLSKEESILLLCKLLKSISNFKIIFTFSESANSVLSKFDKYIKYKNYTMKWDHDNFYNITGLVPDGNKYLLETIVKF